MFVDNGLLRLNEPEQVEESLTQLGIPVRRVDARELFLEALADVTEPEQKRRIIGETFIDVFEEEATRHAPVDFLAQGTIYSDVIESRAPDSKAASRIKSHHNVGGLPETMRLQLVEPLRTLFKDEVRNVGEELGLPHELVWRHPFPGPGSGRARAGRGDRRETGNRAPGGRHSPRRSYAQLRFMKNCGRSLLCCPTCRASA